jgi:hypothetical protein
VTVPADKTLLQRLQERTKEWLPIGEWGPKCAGCGADEYRIDGYCSIECRDYYCDDREDFRAVVALVEAAQRILVDLEAVDVPWPAEERLRAAVASFVEET